jgi:DNA-binding MarR family transcriptional regulator
MQINEATMSDTDVAALAEQMWVVTKDLFKFLQFRDRDAMTACGLSVAQCYSLDAIGTQGRMTLNDLADSLYITASTASRTVDELVRKGLVERRQDATDRRAISLTLTPRGYALFEALRRHLVQQQMAILHQIDPKSRRDVVTALQKLSQAIKDPSCCALPFTWDGPLAAPEPARAETAARTSKRASNRARGLASGGANLSNPRKEMS